MSDEPPVQAQPDVPLVDQPVVVDDPKQILLLDVPPDWKKDWGGMPEFEQRNAEPWQSIYVHFRHRGDQQAFAKLVDQRITDSTRFIYFPKQELDHVAGLRYMTKDPTKAIPRYPIYVISKGRWESRLTSKALEALNVPYRIVVEPQEREQYSAVIDPAKILVLPFSNLGLGSIPARNWVWDHSVKEGAERHWILDDNLRSFYRLHENRKIRVGDGGGFRAIEDFVDRYENVALSGMQYFMFAPRKVKVNPLIMNTRIYSCILIKNDIKSPKTGEPYRWRGRYNEDTDISIRVLKDGWCTILFQAFLCEKMATMTMKGGNTEQLYKIKEGEKDGRLLMAESLQQQHPDIVNIVWKWNRWQHQVNFHLFRDNKLVLRPGVELPPEGDTLGMGLAKLGEGLTDEQAAEADEAGEEEPPPAETGPNPLAAVLAVVAAAETVTPALPEPGLPAQEAVGRPEPAPADSQIAVAPPFAVPSAPEAIRPEPEKPIKSSPTPAGSGDLQLTLF